MVREFKGRAVAAGLWSGPCVVSRTGFNTLASFKKSVLDKASSITVSDQNNQDLYGKNITGVALCLPQTIGSTTGGLIFHAASAIGANPAAMLFSETIDSLAAAGIVLARVWENSDIVVIDRLGDEFLEFVKDGMMIDTREDGTVIVSD